MARGVKQVVLAVKNPPANAKRWELDSWAGRISWSRKWQPASVFLPGKFQGQRSLVGYGPWGHKESDMIEHTHLLQLTAII